jgi:hypothetical protein
VRHSRGLAVISRRGVAVQSLALVAVVALTLAGCEAATTNDPSAIAKSGSQPSAIVLESDGPGSACFANSRACGGFFPKIGDSYNAYLTQSFVDIGAYTRTWSPAGQYMYVSAWGGGKVERTRGSAGNTSVSFQLACSNWATECSDSWHTYNTCGNQRNEISGTTNHFAGGGTLTSTWTGRFSDSRVCDYTGGDEQQCDENGTPVDEGGDPANCEPDGEGGGNDPTGSGIQFQPGDFTGGETVDWNTGIGNGGQSVCGSAAQVETACIDIWNESTGDWSEWSCGYATTC